MISDAEVAALRRAVDSTLLENPVWGGVALEPGETRVLSGFVEHVPAVQALLRHESFMAINRTLTGREMTLNRSSGMARAPGTGSLGCEQPIPSCPPPCLLCSN